MTTNETDRIFDKLEGIADRLAHMETGHEEAVKKIDSMSSKLDTITRDGCAVGREQERRLAIVEARPGKMLGAVATMSAIISAIVGAIMWLVGHTGGKQ